MKLFSLAGLIRKSRVTGRRSRVMGHRSWVTGCRIRVTDRWPWVTGLIFSFFEVFPRSGKSYSTCDTIHTNISSIHAKYTYKHHKKHTQFDCDKLSDTAWLLD